MTIIHNQHKRVSRWGSVGRALLIGLLILSAPRSIPIVEHGYSPQPRSAIENLFPPPGCPVFSPIEQSYNPTGEFIFPSIFRTAGRIDAPLAKWYLYYSPHDIPGGISLMYSDTLDGPWTEYSGNPIISNKWEGEYSVAHVAAPDAVWNLAERAMFVYFHGDNDVTRYAVSEDGLSFDETGIALTANDVSPTTTEVSYSRVFPSPADESSWAMYFMENTIADRRQIRVARSPDGRTWVADPEPLIEGNRIQGPDVSGANTWSYEGRDFVIYHASSGNIYAREIDKDLRVVGQAKILFTGSPPSVRAASPEIVLDGSAWHLFYESGDRLQANIAHTKASSSGLTRNRCTPQ